MISNHYIKYNKHCELVLCDLYLSYRRYLRDDISIAKVTI